MVHEEVLHKLRKVPWISLKFQEKVYFIKKDFKEKEYFLLATDLTNIWARYSGDRDISSEKEDYNPQLETATANVMVILSKQFETQRPEVKYKYVLQQTDAEETPPLLLKIRTKFGTFPFRWTFRCDPVGSAQEQSKTIADYFVYPLMAVNSYLLSLASHFDASTVDQDALVKVPFPSLSH
jgi:hypothetical protein